MERSFETPRVSREEYRSRFRTEEPGAAAPVRTKTEWLLRLIGLQAVLCALVLGVLFAVTRLSPAAMAAAREDYARIMAEDLSVSELAGRLWQRGQRAWRSLDAQPAQAETTVAAAAATTAASTLATAAETQVREETGELVANATMEAAGGGDLEAAEGTSFAPYSVSAPVCMPVQNARITSRFGYRTNPISGKYGFHTGLDLAAPAGTPVAAAFYGTVAETGEDDVWGNYVLLRHSDSLETYYCHLSEVGVAEGTVLRSGETIGAVGSTGWSTGPHLHFEVRINGVRVDPERLLYPEHF